MPENKTNLCTYHCCRLPRAEGSLLCERQHKTEVLPLRPVPLHPSTKPVLDPAPGAAECLACGGTHKLLQDENKCLRREVAGLRKYLAELHSRSG